MKYKDIFIDFDDTLYDTYGNAAIALRETFEAFSLGRYFPTPQTFYDAYWAANIDLWTRYSQGEIGRDYLIAERFRRPLMASQTFRAESERHADEPTHDPGKAEHSRFVTDFSIELSDSFLGHCASKPGVIEGAHLLVKHLRQQGYRLHLCSNGFHEVQYKKLEACGMKGCFDSVILSEDAGANKPSRLFFDYALAKSGAHADTTIMIGDNLLTDIQGARQAGLDTILFNRWGVDPKDIPTYSVDTLTDILHIL